MSTNDPPVVVRELARLGVASLFAHSAVRSLKACAGFYTSEYSGSMPYLNIYALLYMVMEYLRLLGTFRLDRLMGRLYYEHMNSAAGMNKFLSMRSLIYSATATNDGRYCLE